MSDIKCRYLGKEIEVRAKHNPDIKKVTVSLKEDHLLVESPQTGQVDINKALERFYKRQAKRLIEKRLKFYLPNIKKNYRSFSIESDPTRWGSCSSERHLTFNWKLMLFPPEAIDYVVVHELCHLEHMNHDRSFWRLVGKLCPDYKNIMPILGTSKKA